MSTLKQHEKPYSKQSFLAYQRCRDASTDKQQHQQQQPKRSNHQKYHKQQPQQRSSNHANKRVNQFIKQPRSDVSQDAPASHNNTDNALDFTTKPKAKKLCHQDKSQLKAKNKNFQHFANRTLKSSNSPQPNNKQPSQPRGRKRQARYEEYLPEDQIIKGLENKLFYEGTLRINAYKRNEAYVTVEGFDQDILIDGEIQRNRALEGDVVVIIVDDRSQWKKRKKDQSASDASSEDDEASIESLDSYEIAISDDSDSEAISITSEQIPFEDDEASTNLYNDYEYSRFNDVYEHYIRNNSSEDADEDTDSSSDNDDSTSDNEAVPRFFDLFDQYDELLYSSSLSGAIALGDQINSEDSVKQQADEEDASTPAQISMAAPEAEEGYIIQPTGRVVAILQSRHQREHAGHLRACHKDNKIHDNDKYVVFVPLNKRWPRMLIPTSDCEKICPHFLWDPKEHANELFVVKIKRWSENSMLPIAKLKKYLGHAGDLDAETEAILTENGIESGNFSTQALKCLKKFENPKSSWKIPKTELKNRKDLRKKRIFSIDPATAKDLDDALSITPLQNGIFEVGVHIADVSFFVEPNSQLDLEARARGTTVYLPHKSIPMLPPLLSHDLCSLNPGVDRLAFSVFFLVNREGELISPNGGGSEHANLTWFGHTVIRSCAKLDYDTAQAIIDGSIKREEDVPQQYRALDGHSTNGLIRDVQLLHKIASKRRASRFANSNAIQLNRPKIQFQFECPMGNEFATATPPTDLSIFEAKESNHLVEEFMLIANFLVSRQLIQHCREFALLRNHPPPQPQKFQKFQEFVSRYAAESLGADGTAAQTTTCETATLQHLSPAKVLQTLRLILRKDGTAVAAAAAANNGDNDTTLSKVLEYMATKSMQNAKYFCAGDLDMEQWRHFALDMPYYTHFTSPIRRYADIVVHRLLDWLIQTTKPTSDSDDNSHHSTHTKGNIPKHHHSSSCGNKNKGHHHHHSQDFDCKPPLPFQPKTLAEIATRCNAKRLSAKRAEEQTARAFLCHLLKNNNNNNNTSSSNSSSASTSALDNDQDYQQQQVEQPRALLRAAYDAVVIGFGKKSLHVLLPELGLSGRVVVDEYQLVEPPVLDRKEQQLVLNWRRTPSSSSSSASVVATTVVSDCNNGVSNDASAASAAGDKCTYGILDRVHVQIRARSNKVPTELEFVLLRGIVGAITASASQSPSQQAMATSAQ